MVESQSPNNPDNPGSGLRPLRGIFVGRQREIAELKAALDDVVSGHGRLAMLAGEPGIGKTRIAQELASHAETSGAQVLWGRCYEEEGTPAYWPWLQLLRSYIQQQAPEQLQVEMGSGAANIAEIVPELREKLPNLETPPSLEPEQARFRLFSSITNFLKNAALSQPLMLVLDDLHWADRSSLLLLEFLAREIQSSPLMVLGTYRDVEVSRRHPLSQTLGSLIREQRFLRVQLTGLAEPEVEQLIQSALAVSPPPGLTATIHQRTEGNPLFVTEIMRMLPGKGLEESPDFFTGIPEGIRDAIGRRLNQLSEGCNDTLTTASVIGREFDFQLLSALMDDLTEASLLKWVDEALAAHVIEELPKGRERYQFSHALIQETLSQELSTSRKVRLHAQIGQALEELYGDDSESHATELAYHFAEAETVLGTEKLIRYSLLAGEQSLATYAWEEALAHFQQGLRAKGVSATGVEPAADAKAAALLSGLGQAQAGTQDRLSSLPVQVTLTRAFDYYVAVGDTPQAVTIAAYHLPGSFGIEMIEKALELVPSDSHDAGRLQARYIVPLRADYEKAQEAFQRALSIAQQQQDPALEMMTLTSGACVDFTNCRFEQSLDRNLRAIELAGRAERPAEESHARYDLMHVYWAMGELEAASLHAEALLEPAEQSGVRYWQSRAMDARENVSSAKGDWQVARAFSERGLALQPRDPVLLGCRALLEYQTGDFDAAEDYLQRLLSIFDNGQLRTTTYPNVFTMYYTVPSVVIAVAARITGVMERFDLVEAIARSLFTSPFAHPGPVNAARIGLALIAIQRGDAGAAGELYGALEAVGGTMSPQCPMGPGLAGDRLLGLLSQTSGNFNQAVAHFGNALAFCRKAGYRPELAWTCHDYADTLLLRGDPGDRDKAVALLDESLAISTELGMRPLMERVAALQERAASQQAKAPAYPDGLTQREVEVLQLIAAGKTDREIADELFVSVRTVGYHVGNILNKTSTSNRAEAAAYATRQGLV